MNRYLYTGHDLDAGYADGQASGYGECYSGGRCYGPGPGTDQTPEAVEGELEGKWSVMARFLTDRLLREADAFRIAFSIEKLSTIDTEDIPSVDD